MLCTSSHRWSRCRPCLSPLNFVYLAEGLFLEGCLGMKSRDSCLLYCVRRACRCRWLDLVVVSGGASGACPAWHPPTPAPLDASLPYSEGIRILTCIYEASSGKIQRSPTCTPSASPPEVFRDVITYSAAISDWSYTMAWQGRIFQTANNRS